MPRKNNRSRSHAETKVEVSAEASNLPEGTSVAGAESDAHPARRGRLHHLISGFARDIPSIARPGSWFAFRGRMTRQAFWLFYLFNIMMISAAAALSELIANFVPSAVDYVLPLFLFVVMVGSMIALCGAMMRRLRDARISIWVAPLALLSLFAAITIWLIEGVLYQMNAAQGTLDAWFASRFPLTESAGLTAFILAAILFFGLVRRSRPTSG